MSHTFLTRAFALLLVLCSLPIFGQDSLTFNRLSDGQDVPIAYADIIQVRQTTGGLATVYYGRSNDALQTSEDFESVVARTACRLLPFTNSYSGRRQAVSYAIVDSVDAKGGRANGAAIHVSSDALNIPPSKYYTQERGTAVYSLYYNCGGSSPNDPIVAGQNVGYGLPLYYGRSGNLLQIRSIVTTGGLTHRNEGGTMIIDGSGLGGGGGGGGTTNLTTAYDPNFVELPPSGGGTSAFILAANGSRAGAFTSQLYTKLNGIEAGAQVNRTGAATVSLLDQELGGSTWRLGTGVTNLSFSRTASEFQISSSTGTPATVPAATTTLAGAMTATDKTKLNGIQAGAEVNWTDQEIIQLIDGLLGTGWKNGGLGNATLTAGSLTGKFWSTGTPTFTKTANGEYTINLSSNPVGSASIDITHDNGSAEFTGDGQVIITLIAGSFRPAQITVLDVNTNTEVPLFQSGVVVTQEQSGNTNTITFPNMQGTTGGAFVITLRL